MLERKIVFTGGHGATTALAVIEEIKSRKYDWDIYWIGSRSAVEGRKEKTLEYEFFPKHGIKFLPIITGRFQRRFTFWTIPSILTIPIGFAQAFWHIFKIKPEVVLSFGGYSAFPVVVCAKLLGVKVVIHEQTSAAGRANLASKAFADKIALSRSDSLKYFPKNKCEITGNPISRRMFLIKKKGILGIHPVLYVTGGSRGSQSINSAVLEVLPELLKNFIVIHQTGEIDAQKFKNEKEILPKNISDNYIVFSRVSPDKIVTFFEKADIIISRSGANTVSDILAAKRPAIVVPLPISFMDEQTRNAEFLEKFGFTHIIPQEKLTGDRLLSEINKIISNYKMIVGKANKSSSPDKEASKKLVDIIREYLR